MARENGVTYDIVLENGLDGYEAFDTGLDYYQGENGKPQDYAQAKYLFEQAAKYHIANACGMLGGMAEDGILLTAPDLAQALSWYELAYRYGNDEATDDIDRVKTAMSRPAFHTKKSFF
ncbi:MAG: hypothetical protein K6E48_07385 [Lachnospiraceae bacterium]|nr:hypothetical protein [Lachnospiraceae bacterium]